jgi:hypothetical protein
MSQTLLIESNEQRGSMLSLNLEVYTGTNVICKSSIEEALKVLRVLPEINLILALDDQVGSMNPLLENLEEQDLRVPIISSFEKQLGSELVKPLRDDFDLTEIIKTASDNLGIKKADLVRKIMPDFFPVSIDSFKYLDKCVCDLYIKLKKSDGSFRYVKRMNAGDVIDEETIHRYILKKVEKLYILKDDRFNFTDAFSSSVLSKLNDETLAVEEQVQVLNSATDVVRFIFKNEDFNENDVKLIEDCCSSLERISKKDVKLSELIGGLLDAKNSYRYQLAVVTSYLGMKALKKMGVGSISVLEAQMEKYIQACFLHDILLTNDDQARVRTEADIDKFQIIEKELVLTHAMTTAEMVKSLPNISDEVVRIITEQHGKPTGSGFSFEFLNRLHPLSLVLISCEAYAHEILAHQGREFDDDDIIRKLPPVFLKKQFWKVLSNIG